MRISADQALSPQSSVATAPTSAHEVPAHAGVSNPVVLTYLLLTIAVLAPGIAAQFMAPPDSASTAGRLLEFIRSALHDIRFGSGLRFWLGVVGATLMFMLLAYPVRKALVKSRGFGSVSAWFHLHIIIGFAGPTLILYHCNFGTGGTNANVALWTMLAVAISGLVGQFVYRRVSAGFYGDKTKARGHLDQLKQLFIQIEGMHPTKTRLSEDLESFDAMLLTPRQGIIASLRRRVRIEERAHHFLREIAGMTGAALRTQVWAPGQHRQVHNAMIGHLRAYIRFARSGAGRAIREQIWARWRLFHMPLFLIMCVATILHVYMVWDMDGADANSVLTPQVEEAAAAPPAPAPARAAKRSGEVKQLAVRTSRVEVGAEATTAPKKPTESVAATSPQPTVPTPEPTPASIADLLATETQRPNADGAAEPQALVVPTPVPAPRPAPAPKQRVTQKPLEDPTPKIVAKKNDGYSPPTLTKSVPPPVEVAAQAPKPEPAATASAASKDVGQAAVAELRKRNDEPAAMMGLGVKGRNLAEQIALLKTKIKDGSFHHNDAETGFALTGKHVKVDCANCHQKPFREARQPKVRACIDCHKQDDIHRGRRPDCAQCHVPTRWSQIVDRKKK